MTDNKLEDLSNQLSGRKNPSNPPLHLWHPPLSGDIDIVIRSDGSWWHEGSPIQRESLVRLFAGILRREDDGEYYLVTPVEKWRLRVECLPLLVVDFTLEEPGTPEQCLRVTTNTGRDYTVSKQYPLFLQEPADAGESGGDGVAAVALDHGLAALFSRAAWYRLADLCEDGERGIGLMSSGIFFPIA